MISFKGRGARLDDIDIPRIGATIGVGEDEIHAFMDVEAAGSGFDKQGRPKMLFEPHIFHRHLSGAKLARAVKEGLAYPRWRPGAYPVDSYPRLLKAIAIDETAALKASSWGLGQILGENHAAAGFKTPQAMVQAFADDEAAQLAGMVSFLVANHLDDDLRAHRWEGLARGYNGPGYAANRYPEKLAAAFSKWRRIPDTPYMVATNDNAGPVTRSRIGRGSRGADVRAWQLVLVVAGFAVTTDGAFGEKTEAATQAWQRQRGLVPDGVVGTLSWAASAQPTLKAAA